MSTTCGDSPRDPLAARPVEGPDRLYYDEGVMLDAQDFRDEQIYHRGRLARALKYLAGPGTVAGLAVTAPRDNGPETEQIHVAPGMAFDAVGRIIELHRPACMRTQQWWDGLVTNTDGTPNTAGQSALRDAWHAGGGRAPSGVVVDVFLRFVQCERGMTPAFATGPYDALDAVRPSRTRDGYQLSLVLRDEEDPPFPTPLLGPTEEGEESPPDLGTAILRMVLGSWREGTDTWTGDKPNRLPEHPLDPDFDTTSVLLARLVIPADETLEAAVPTRRLDEPVYVENWIRRLAMTPGVFLRWSLGV